MVATDITVFWESPSPWSIGPIICSIDIWAIPAETTILPSKNETGPGQILFLQILFFLHDNGQVYLS